MKPLNIALIVKNENSTRRDVRPMGYFSYDVPEFTWTHILPGKRFTVDSKELKRKGFDLIFHEDYPFGTIKGNSLPYVFLSIDSTLSELHYKHRVEQAGKADLILIDHDEPSRFSDKTLRLPYCINDKLFYSHLGTNRQTDIAYHCSATAHAGIDKRKHIRQLLHDLSVKHKWSYRSGVMGVFEYAQSYRFSKIAVNQSRTPINRPHRIFDAMACGAMVLSSPLPHIKEDGLQNGWNYCEYKDDDNLEFYIRHLLNNPEDLHDVAIRGYNLVMTKHTWSIRAKELRTILDANFSFNQ